MSRSLAAVLVAMVVATGLYSAGARAARAVIVIRHAEKERDAGKDPDLSITGEDRALSLTTFLHHDKIDAIYVTEYKRTQKTAAALAELKGVKPVVVKAGDTKGLVAKIAALPKDAVVVVVGHSNTVPEILAALGVKDKVSLRENEYNRVFVVTPKDGGLLEFTY